VTKLTIKQELAAIDKRDYSWYNSLSADERKKFDKGMFVIMRWMSSVRSNVDEINEHYLVMTNELVNRHFGSIKRHPEFQHRLLQIVGIGATQQHQWINAMRHYKTGKNVNSKLFALYKKSNPAMNADEVNMVIQQSSAEEIVEYLEAHGIEKKRIKEYTK